MSHSQTRIKIGSIPTREDPTSPIGMTQFLYCNVLSSRFCLEHIDPISSLLPLFLIILTHLIRTFPFSLLMLLLCRFFPSYVSHRRGLNVETTLKAIHEEL